jgi:hypothetical protein
MFNVSNLMDHIVKEVGVPDEASYPFKVGYMIGLLNDLQLRYPEVVEFLETHARKYSYTENA